MAALVRDTDWSRTPLGPAGRWPAGLRVLVGLLLAQPTPAVLLWGPDLVQIYNDAYRPIAGDRHPAALGRPTHDCWPDARDVTAPLYERVRSTGRAASVTDRLIRIDRAGVPEDRYFTVSYTPVFDDAGGVAGIYANVTETTERVRADRERRSADESRRMSEFRFHRLVDQSPLSTQIFAPDGTTRKVNPAWERLWGITLADLPGYNILHDPELARLGMTPLFRKAFAGEHPVTIEPIPYVLDRGRYAGQPRWVGAYLYPVMDDAGRVDEVVLVHDDVTERRAAEEALRESEARLRALVEQSAAGIAQVDTSGRFVFANQRFCDLIGYTLDELRTRTLQDVTHPDDLPANLASIERTTAAGGTDFHIEKRYVRKDGSPVWVSVSVKIIPGPDGKPASILGVVVDIDARRRAEQAARDAERRYRDVFHASRDAMVVYTPDGVIVDVNPAATEIYGFAREEFLGLRAGDVIPEETRPMFREFLRVTSAGGTFRGEAVDRRRDGSTFPIEVVGTPLSHDGGPHVMAVVRDITDRKRALDRVTRLYTVAAALSEAVTPADVARVTVEQGITALGANAGSLSLLTPDGGHLEMAGSVGYPAGSMDAWQRFPVSAPIPLTDAVRSGRPVYTDSPEDRARRYPGLSGVSAVAGTRSSACLPLVIGGKTLGVLGLSFPTPGASSADDREFMVSLARQCAQALERARLFESERAARAEAERASDAKSEFLATLSHELRTPLTPVLLSVSMMESHPDLPPAFRDDVAAIRRNVELESRLISDLLDLTRITRGKLQLEPRDVDVHAAIRAAIDICQREASANLVVRFDASHHTVHGDPTRLQQIFWNLINNAQKFTPPEGTITIRTRNGDAAPSPVGTPPPLVVEISDTGVGIDPAVLPRLFAAFEQGDTRLTRQHAGLGLGLAISRRLAEAHAGALTAASPGPNQGATFTLTLPTVPAPQPPPPPSPHPPLATGNSQPATPLTILLVEDHAPTLRILSRLLTQLGHRVTGVSTAAAATSAASQDRYDMLICDLGLPDGSGLDVMRRLRDRYAGRAVALTGYGMDSDVAASLQAGFSVHLTKPVDLQRLQSTIADLARSAGQK
jgi:PAS domain S-box-containing protein